MKKEVDIQFISTVDGCWAAPSFPIYCGNIKCRHYEASIKYELGRCITSPELIITKDRVVFCKSASA